MRPMLSLDRLGRRNFGHYFLHQVAVYSLSGAILLADSDGYTHGTMLGRDRIELCYLHVSTAAQVASCTELTKQP